MSAEQEPKKEAKPVEKVKVPFPLALKLIVFAGGLVLLMATGFVVWGMFQTQKDFRHFAADRKKAEVEALTARGLATIRGLANTLGADMFGGEAARISDSLRAFSGSDVDLRRALIFKPGKQLLGSIPEQALPATAPKDVTDLMGVLSTTTTEVRALTKIEADELPPLLAIGASNVVGNRHVGYLYFEFSTDKIKKTVLKIESDRRRAVRNGLVQTIGIGGAALLLGAVIAVLVGLQIGSTIRNLAQVAAEVGAGNLKARAPVGGSDEIGLLASRFNDMTGQLENLIQESVAKAALDQELERAHQIQSLLLPPRDLLEHARMRYCGYFDMATQMGGDWWHHYPLSEHKTLLCIGDVTGHGIASAMLTASTKACCDTVLWNNPDLDLPVFMRALDHAIREAGKGNLVMTFFAAVFDTQAMTVNFVNAGHNFPMLVRGGKVKSLVARGGRLGDGGDYEAATEPIEAGDFIAMYTDGIVECRNTEGEEFGMRRFKKLVQSSAAVDPLTARTNIINEAYDFFGTMPHDDDITLVLARVA